MSNSGTKIIARFPTLLEAEAAVATLEAAGISAIVNNAITGSMLPYASDSLGGFHVSVEEEKEGEARGVLEGATPEETFYVEPLSVSYRVDQLMKRGTYGAVLGCMILPVIANGFSLSLYAKAYRLSPAEFWRHKWLLVLGVVFNTFGFGMGLFFLLRFLGGIR